MDFSLSEEQEMFRNYVRKYLNDLEQTKIARNYLEGNDVALKSAMDGLAELGCMSLNIEEQYGGMALAALDLVPIYEEIGAVLLPGLLLETLSLVVPLLQKYGTKEQQEKHLPKIAAGQETWTIAWLESNSSYRPAGVQFNAENGLLNGKKILVPDAAIADYTLVVARTTAGREIAGITLIIVPTSELSVQPQLNIDATRKSAALVATAIPYDTTQILGTMDTGWGILQEGLLAFNAALSSTIVGSLDKLVAMVTEYANIREQFGQPIGRFQAIKHRIVDMKMELETARSLSHYANWAYDTHAPDRVEAIASARIYATEAFNKLADHSVQIHGGIGFTEELDCHLFVKRARFYENYLGSTEQYYEQAATALGW
ncbi:acyl-CoA dehydrogenase family protein [Kurthia sibirica]|uniref:Acyl-CoA dehydrogenase n=1 Tax=Kurthia sibirica TaxID=202750 RepID=A0A2U3ALJ5_9BACL|nr:acyl-CoA dehydrogenase family protein [Kurthia sibirica]PWI25387.1 acyl-CoA dehydrogenase [Kurthia sibirica]GEK34596.1 dehydrogenase [Kurthia sibirica]